MDIMDLIKMKDNDLLDLLEQIIARDNYGEADAKNINSDTVLYQQVRIELEARLCGVYAGRKQQ